jgi:hypothetical protein
MLDRAGGIITAVLGGTPGGWHISELKNQVIWRAGFFGNTLQTSDAPTPSLRKEPPAETRNPSCGPRPPTRSWNDSRIGSHRWQMLDECVGGGRLKLELVEHCCRSCGRGLTLRYRPVDFVGRRSS